jgi:CcmD family protein
VDNWGFVFLAHGVVWGTILVYLFRLKGRIRRLLLEIQRMEGAFKGNDGD